jgi:hypothetical protein
MVHHHHPAHDGGLSEVTDAAPSAHVKSMFKHETIFGETSAGETERHDFE